MIVKTIPAVVNANPDKGIDEAIKATADFNLPETLEEAVDVVGDEVVFNTYMQQHIIKAQAGMRTRMVQKNEDGSIGCSDDVLQAWADTWKPGLIKPKKSKNEKAMELVKGMTPEELQNFIANLG